MKLVNKTQWRSEDLRKLFRAGMRERGATHRLTVTVVYSRSHWVTGRGWYGWDSFDGVRHKHIPGDRILMRLPRPTKMDKWIAHRSGASFPEDVAAVFMHELAHNFGVRHRQMNRDLYRCRQNVSWSSSFTLHATEEPQVERLPRAAALASVIQRRAERAAKKVADLEALINRKNKLLKQWRAKVRYYEKKGVLNLNSE